MTLKEAVLKSLEDINEITNYMAVYNNIVEKNYYDFKDSKTPTASVSAILGDYIRLGDTRVMRVKQEGGTYSYYLKKNEHNIDTEVLIRPTERVIEKKVDKIKMIVPLCVLRAFVVNIIIAGFRR